MRAIDGTRIKEYLTCPRLPFLTYQLGEQAALPPTSAAEILFAAGRRVERRLLEAYQAERPDYPCGDFAAGCAQTLALMDRRVPAIADGVLKLGEFLGRPDLLLLDEASGRYEVADIKSTRKVHASAVLQVAFYSRMLAQIRPTPGRGHLLLRDGERFSFAVQEYFASVERIVRRLESFRVSVAADPLPQLAVSCVECRFREVCGADLERSDGLGRVPGLSRAQAAALRRAGVETVARLAAADSAWLPRATGLNPDLARRLCRAAEAVRDGRPLRHGAPSAALGAASIALAGLHSERLAEPAVAVAGMAGGDPARFRLRLFRSRPPGQAAREFSAMMANLAASRGPILTYGPAVDRCLTALEGEAPDLIQAVARVRERRVDLRQELRRTLALPGLDLSPAQAARALGLDCGADDDLEVRVLAWLEGDGTDHVERGRAAVEELLRRDLRLMEAIRRRLLAAGPAPALSDLPARGI